MLWFGPHASNTRIAKFFNIHIYEWLSITATDEFQCFILSEMICKNVIVMVL